MIIAVDFDGTIVENQFPDIGPEVPFALSTLRVLQKKGHKIVLWTVRADENLNNAVMFLKEKGIELYGINSNPEQPTNSPKMYANLYIDDKALGCPLIIPGNNEEDAETKKPYVNWLNIGIELGKYGII